MILYVLVDTGMISDIGDLPLWTEGVGALVQKAIKKEPATARKLDGQGGENENNTGSKLKGEKLFLAACLLSSRKLQRT